MKMEDFILSVINKVIVTSQLSDGDTIDVSVKSVDKPLSQVNRIELDRRIRQSIIPALDDTLYMKIRLTLGKSKDNWNKIKTVTELNEILDKIFKEQVC